MPGPRRRDRRLDVALAVRGGREQQRQDDSRFGLLGHRVQGLRNRRTYVVHIGQSYVGVWGEQAHPVNEAIENLTRARVPRTMCHGH